ncbi:MAG TPA: ABC transporter substrate-binding protein [Ruminiclostridium sp.]|nr:ABC transporter substrate-binding protein [Ruminiclostridium sp.]
MKRAIQIVASVLCIFVLLQGCAKSPYRANSGKTKTITDCIGRKVIIPEKPQRVACLYAATAHMLVLVDEGGKIVGSPDGVKRDVAMQIKYPGIKNISVPFQNGSINVEELLKINADIALVRKSTAENPAEAEKLNRLNIPYAVVDFSSVNELKKAITVIGNIFDKRAVTDSYIRYMDDTFAYVKNRLNGLGDQQKISVYHSLNQATKSYSSGCISADIINIAEVKNVAANADLGNGESGRDTTLEQIYSWNPQAIMVNDYNVVGYIYSNKKWQGLTAVQNKKVIALPVGLSRWGHFGSIEPQMGALFIASTLYPDRFRDLNLTQTVKDYYTRFFKLNITETIAQKILSGEGMRAAK